MKMRLPLLGALFIGVWCAACAGTSRVLALKDVQTLSATQVSADPLTIRVSGLALHSAMVVSAIEVVQKNDAATIVAHLALAREGKSGNFAYAYIVPDAVNKVSFGSGNAVIWTRTSGFEMRNPE